MTAAALQRRRDAIAVSGWGARFHFVQPHNACFWVYLALVASGFWYVITAVQATRGAFDEAYATALVTSGVFCAAFLAFLHWSDRWERTPASLALAGFVGGGIAAPFAIAITGNSAIMSIYTKVFGQAWATDWQAGLTAPFVEETSKGAIFLLMMGLAPVVIRTVSDGLIVGAYVGLGFQILEDIFYAQNSAFAQFGAHQSEAVLGTFVLRAVTGIPSHALYTALFGAGLIYLIGTPAQPRRVGARAGAGPGRDGAARGVGLGGGDRRPRLRHRGAVRDDGVLPRRPARRDPLGRPPRTGLHARHHGP